MNEDQDISFGVSGDVGDSLRFFNIDGSDALPVDVWVEALDDKRFWLDYFKSNDRYKFYVRGPDEAVAPDGKVANGCDRLFSLERQSVLTLGVGCIFCIDSDDSYLKSFVPGYVSQKLPRDHVFVTNIYALDNAFVYSEYVDHAFGLLVCKGGHELKVLPSKFIASVSSSIWSAFVGIYYLEVIGRDKEFSLSKRLINNALDKLGKVIISEFDQCEVYNNYLAEVADIESAVRSALLTVGQEGYDLFCSELETAGVSADNVYLFLRGHNLFDVVASVYEVVSQEFKCIEIERVKTVHANSASVVAGIEKNWQAVSSFLKARFSLVGADIPFLKCTLERISADYSL
ncbi:DUF4435 domain-containing protein [Pseudomonas sp. Irchel s3h14]|uniref:DUF4435 domain-containing protein n=1 Tax=Pseudomonas sp. Irchel s3h14 TaxID=2009179 RepID=UPI000BA427F1|nr:DUF4435 domain-containing protein [Pseudomonas sp. Irchel s3h14]